MGDEQKNKSISDIINQHPRIRKWVKRSGVGLLFSALFTLVIKYMGEVDFDENMKWIKQLISLILSIFKPNILLWFIVILGFIYICIKLKEKWKFKLKFLDDAKTMIENDSSISNISIKEDKKSDSISINIQREEKVKLATKADNNVVDFLHYNSEAK